MERTAEVFVKLLLLIVRRFWLLVIVCIPVLVSFALYGYISPQDYPIWVKMLFEVLPSASLLAFIILTARDTYRWIKYGWEEMMYGTEKIPQNNVGR